MSTELEKYLEKNRQSLDVEYPDDDKIWGAIRDKSISPSKDGPEKSNRVFQFRNLWKIAAMITLLLSLSYITFDIVNGTGPGSNRVALSAINAGLGDIEKEYIRSVTLKQEELDSYKHYENDIINSLLSDLKQQDRLFNESVGDIEELGNDDMLINTIFRIYERKIEILERIIIEINKIENNEKNNEASI